MSVFLLPFIGVDDIVYFVRSIVLTVPNQSVMFKNLQS